MSKIHIAIDAGGSKVNTILYDDQFNLISTHRTGSLRDNTTDPSLVKANLQFLLDDMNIAGKEIGLVSGISDPILARTLHENYAVEQFRFIGEMGVGLAAAELFGDALLALSGTGATSFARINNECLAIGGYGASVYDGGSGYWIGRAAFNAAIADDEERGPRTVLTDMLCRKLGGDRSTFSRSVFEIYGQKNVSPTAYVASCTPLVSDAAFAGDAVAQRILASAGYLVGSQLAALVKRHNLSRTLPVTISGSVWRSHPIMFETFRDTLAEANLDGNLHIPRFEPIVGAIIAHHYAVYGKFDAHDSERFAAMYDKYLFNVSADLKNMPNPQPITPRPGHNLNAVRHSVVI